jgi:ABC-type transport system substrate-binding protein
LHDVGLVAHPRGLTAALYNGSAATGAALASGTFDLALFTWTAGIDPDNSTQLLCADVAPAGYNEARFCSARMDAAQRRALGTFDRRQRKAAYASIEEQLVADNPTIFLMWDGFTQGLSVDVHGVEPNPVVEMWNPRDWSI